MIKRLHEFSIFESHRISNCLKQKNKNLLSKAKTAYSKAQTLKSKNHLIMRDLLLQEKLLGNLGRWEEAVNNKKVSMKFKQTN